jgi:hypothetical protein
MINKTLLFSIIGIATISLFSFTRNNESIGNYNHAAAKYASGSIVGYTGAPGDIGSCTNCHGGSVASTNSAITFINFSGTNNTYVPGSTYTINIELIGTGSNVHGFEIVALRNSDNANSGAIVITDASNTQLKIGGGRTYVTHTSNGKNTNTWSFDWTAPTNGDGDITFYLAANVSNANGLTTGDEIHLKELVIQEDISSAVIEEEPIVRIDNSLKLINDNNFVTTTLDVQEANDVLVSVLSLSGKVIYSTYDIVNKGANTLQSIDFNQFSKGIYIINYKIGNDLISRKILI